MKINYTSFSETGKRRTNQDVCRIVEMPEHNRVLFVVCDGMGGHSMGDVAAETVCNAIYGYWIQNEETPDSETKVIKGCKLAADALYTRSQVVPPIEMGTTLAMVSVEGCIATVVHCGDSRCYLLRDGGVVHQTQDHSVSYLGSEFMTKCFFSMRPEVAVPDIARFEVKQGDRIFICSDGVYKAIAPEILTARLQDNKSLEQVVDVIKFLCEKYSTDNYTAILAEINF